VMFGGEALTADLVQQVRAHNPMLPVMNHYGPTEATVGCCVHQVPTGQDTQEILRLAGRFRVCGRLFARRVDRPCRTVWPVSCGSREVGWLRDIGASRTLLRPRS
jgi:hypothetical protein